ncbi:MAG: hypothetical protein AAB500_00550 [Patescibacteria group bacterium]
MTEVIPAIITKTYDELKNKISLVRGIVPIAQIDICDGIFAKNLTWPFTLDGMDIHFKRIENEEEGLPFWEDIDFELDLMVSDAIQNFDIYAKLGARRLIFHLESVGDAQGFLEFLEGMDRYVRDTIDIGVAFKPSTALEQIFPLREQIDFVQCMGNDKVSFGGVELDERVYGRVETLRKQFPELPIAVDIGVNAVTAPRLVAAGATKLVAGSALFNSSDIIGTIRGFQEL